MIWSYLSILLIHSSRGSYFRRSLKLLVISVNKPIGDAWGCKNCTQTLNILNFLFSPVSEVKLSQFWTVWRQFCEMSRTPFSSICAPKMCVFIKSKTKYNTCAHEAPNKALASRVWHDLLPPQWGMAIRPHSGLIVLRDCSAGSKATSPTPQLRSSCWGTLQSYVCVLCLRNYTRGTPLPGGAWVTLLIRQSSAAQTTILLPVCMLRCSAKRERFTLDAALTNQPSRNSTRPLQQLLRVAANSMNCWNELRLWA